MLVRFQAGAVPRDHAWSGHTADHTTYDAKPMLKTDLLFVHAKFLIPIRKRASHIDAISTLFPLD